MEQPKAAVVAQMASVICQLAATERQVISRALRFIIQPVEQVVPLVQAAQAQLQPLTVTAEPADLEDCRVLVPALRVIQVL